MIHVCGDRFSSICLAPSGISPFTNTESVRKTASSSYCYDVTRACAGGAQVHRGPVCIAPNNRAKINKETGSSVKNITSYYYQKCSFCLVTCTSVCKCGRVGGQNELVHKMEIDGCRCDSCLWRPVFIYLPGTKWYSTFHKHGECSENS